MLPKQKLNSHELIIANVLLTDEALSGVMLSDRISVPTARTINDQGQMIVPCKFARTGSQLYTAKQLGLTDEKPNKVITVYRKEDDVFDEESMKSFRSAPVTIGHPKDESGQPVKVTASNSKELQVGVLEGMPARDEDCLAGTLVLTAQEAIDALDAGTQELSAGYTCDISVVDGKYFQSNIKANHIAIVDKGRAGSSCRISDEALDVKEEATLETNVNDDHPEPMEWDFKDEESYQNAMEIWRENEAAEQKEVKAQDEALQLIATSLGDSGIDFTNVNLADAVEAVAVALADSKATIQTLTDEALAHTKEMEDMAIQVADAKVAAEEGVVVRSNAIESARLIADMRDLGSKTVAQIQHMVVTDQMPEKDLTGKSEEFVAALFEMLDDASKGDTPMSKLIRKSDLADTQVVVAKKTNLVADARERSIARNKTSK